jgi:ParB-like chromosome segregation protein Spo0J
VVALESIEFFHASEEVNAAHVRDLAQSIKAVGDWLVPIPIECRTGLVMDGNHRLRVARMLGLRRLPASRP